MSTFSVVGSVNFRTRLERPLVWSIGDSEIFHVQLLKKLTKNDPGNYHNLVLVQKGRRMTRTQMCLNYEIYVQSRGGFKHKNYNIFRI